MVNTRNSASHNKSHQDLLYKLCNSIVERTQRAGFFNDVAECVSAYMKLVEHRNDLIKMRKNEFLTLLNSPNEFERLENFDRECISVLEKLYNAIPADHSLKKRDIPPHLQPTTPDERGAGDGAQTPRNNNGKKPNLQEFDGKSSSWLCWKVVFEREMEVNGELSLEHKFSYLIGSIKKNTFASKIVSNYVGVEGAYDLAWKDLTNHYLSTSDVKRTHLQALRDLPKRHKVIRCEDVRRLEDLYQTAWGRVNALKALKADTALYRPLAVMGLSEALPDTLRVKFLLDHDAEDLDESHFDNLFQFLKKEVDARRRSWQMTQEKSKPRIQMEEKKKPGFEKPETKGRFQGKNKYQKDKSKQSSMLLESQEEETSKDLNQ